MAELTLEDIAKQVGVSRSTVSRVVNGSPNVSPEVRLQESPAFIQMQQRGLSLLNAPVLSGLCCPAASALFSPIHSFRSLPRVLRLDAMQTTFHFHSSWSPIKRMKIKLCRAFLAAACWMAFWSNRVVQTTLLWNV